MCGFRGGGAAKGCKNIPAFLRRIGISVFEDGERGPFRPPLVSGSAFQLWTRCPDDTTQKLCDELELVMAAAIF